MYFMYFMYFIRYNKQGRYGNAEIYWSIEYKVKVCANVSANIA